MIGRVIESIDSGFQSPRQKRNLAATETDVFYGTIAVCISERRRPGLHQAMHAGPAAFPALGTPGSTKRHMVRKLTGVSAFTEKSSDTNADQAVTLPPGFDGERRATRGRSRQRVLANDMIAGRDRPR
jgi:hypothetical protein